MALTEHSPFMSDATIVVWPLTIGRVTKMNMERSPHL
jgi:hypothetical protein